MGEGETAKAARVRAGGASDGAWNPGLPLSRENKVDRRFVKSSSFAAFDISLQHIGAKGSASPLPLPLWTAI